MKQIDREVTARRLEKHASGTISAETREQLVCDCAERLEDIINREVLNELERLGKFAQFERLLDQKGDAQAFLARTIPNYANWVGRVVGQAVKEVEG